MTLNESWGYNRGDNHWKSPADVAELLRQCAAGCGNLILNVGPKGDGSIPLESVKCLDRVGKWLKQNGEAIFNTERFVFSLHERGNGRSDFTHLGRFTAAGNAFYWHIRNWPGPTVGLAEVECTVTEVAEFATGKTFPFTQEGGRVASRHAGTEGHNATLVLRFRTKEPPMLYNCGGSACQSEALPLRPLPSDMAITP